MGFEPLVHKYYELFENSMGLRGETFWGFYAGGVDVWSMVHRMPYVMITGSHSNTSFCENYVHDLSALKPLKYFIFLFFLF